MEMVVENLNKAKPILSSNQHIQNRALEISQKEKELMLSQASLRTYHLREHFPWLYVHVQT